MAKFRHTTILFSLKAFSYYSGPFIVCRLRKQIDKILSTSRPRPSINKDIKNRKKMKHTVPSILFLTFILHHTLFHSLNLYLTLPVILFLFSLDLLILILNRHFHLSSITLLFSFSPSLFTLSLLSPFFFVIYLLPFFLLLLSNKMDFSFLVSVSCYRKR